MSGKPFVLGKEKTGGRAKGTRNRLSQEFLSALLAEFEAHRRGYSYLPHRAPDRLRENRGLFDAAGDRISRQHIG